MKEKTLFIIKPDAIAFRERIKSEIAINYTIIQTSLFFFDEAAVEEFYPSDVGMPYYKALLEYMMESFSEAAIIDGENCIESFVEFSGRFSDPAQCGENTLRHKYGKGLDKTQSGLYVIKNGIHRAKDRYEMEKNFNFLLRRGVLKI